MVPLPLGDGETACPAHIENTDAALTLCPCRGGGGPMPKSAKQAPKVVTMDETLPPPAERVPPEAQRKWGKDMMEARFTIVPNVLLERMYALGLDSTDLVVLLHLIKHWWKKENLPYPGINGIAKMMNVHRRT